MYEERQRLNDDKTSFRSFKLGCIQGNRDLTAPNPTLIATLPPPRPPRPSLNNGKGSRVCTCKFGVNGREVGNEDWLLIRRWELTRIIFQWVSSASLLLANPILKKIYIYIYPAKFANKNFQTFLDHQYGPEISKELFPKHKMNCKNVIELNYRKNPQQLWNIETTGHDFLQHPQNGFNYEIP